MKSSEVGAETATSERKPYDAPEVTVYGNIESLTEATPGGLADGGSKLAAGG